MKLSILLALATAAASVVAQPHRHGRRHSPHNVAKRKPSPAVVYEPGAVATVIVYMVDGHQISEQEVREGIAKGVLEWGEDGKLSSSVAALPTATPTPALEAHFEELQALQPSIPPVEAPPQSSDTPAPQSTPEPQAETQAAPASPPSPPSQSPDNPDSPYEGVDKDFPNRKYECHSFPSGFGAIPYGGIGLGGWTGIQDPQRMASNSAGEQGYDDITTVPEGTCEDGACCVPGSFCSYNCPPGYLKSSWPAKQGATKQSVGGLYCNNDNTLEMADGAISAKLCIKGTDQVTVKVQNKLTKPVSICRTDYPGKIDTLSSTSSLTIYRHRSYDSPSYYPAWRDSRGSVSRFYQVLQMGGRGYNGSILHQQTRCPGISGLSMGTGRYRTRELGSCQLRRWLQWSTGLYGAFPQ
jgi:hypothetical protein